MGDEKSYYSFSTRVYRYSRFQTTLTLCTCISIAYRIFLIGESLQSRSWFVGFLQVFVGLVTCQQFISYLLIFYTSSPLFFGWRCTRAEWQTHLFNGIIVVSPLEKCRAIKICSRIRFDIFDRLPVGISIFRMRGGTIFLPKEHLRVPSSVGLDAFNSRFSDIFPKSTNH